MTSLSYFVQEKRKIQDSINEVVDNLNSLKKVNIEDAESVQVLIEDIMQAGQRLSEEQEKFRALVFEHYAPVPPDAPDEEDPDFTEATEEVYEEEQSQPQVEPDPAMQQQAIVQNVITGITALAGAYGIFKSLKK